MARHVFLSFVVEDKTLVELFRGQAQRENSQLEFSDHSVKEPFDSTNAEYIRREIKEMINRTSVTACLIGRTTNQSRWVQWELGTASEMGKGLLGIRLHSSYEDIPPEPLRKLNAEIVDWKNVEVVAAIERAARKAGY